MRKEDINGTMEKEGRGTRRKGVRKGMKGKRKERINREKLHMIVRSQQELLGVNRNC